MLLTVPVLTEAGYWKCLLSTHLHLWRHNLAKQETESGYNCLGEGEPDDLHLPTLNSKSRLCFPVPFSLPCVILSVTLAILYLLCVIQTGPTVSFLFIFLNFFFFI